MMEDAVDMSHCCICDEIVTTRKKLITEHTICSKCYDKVKDSDIDTLRQKLIEIIEGGSWWWVGEPYEINQCFEDARDYLINNINKLFGVKND